MDGPWKLARDIFVGITGLKRRFRHSRRGSVAIMIGIALPVVIGMASLGSEIAFLLFKHRQLQVVADAAAFSAAVAIKTGHPNFAVEARAVATSLGFQDQLNGVTITPNSPPASGPNVGNKSAVEVIVSQTQTLAMASLFHNNLWNVVARAVAIAGAGSSCVLQLDSTTGFTMNNGATANLTKCGLAVDGVGSAALSMSGRAQLTAQSVSVVGRASISNGAAINPSDALRINQPNVPDPYASVTMPSIPGGCSNGTEINGKPISYGHSNSGLQTINPGVWCGSVSFTNDANILLNPGVYYVDGGTFSVGGSVIMKGTGVTVILTSHTSGNYSTATINNGATVTLSAPITGTTAGIVFFGDRRAPARNTNNLEGGASININGALYFPTQTLLFQNGASNPSACTQLVAGTIQLVGGSSFQNNCPTGVATIGAANNTLTE